MPPPRQRPAVSAVGGQAERYIALIRSESDGDYGDRRQKRGFIGMQMNEAEIRAKLNACLLTDNERAQGETAWRNYPDPFQDWQAIASDA